MTVITQANKDRAKALLTQLTLDEKLGMIHGAGLFRTEGVPRLGIPPLKMSDGPMGVRREFADDSWESIYGSRDHVTYLPCGSAIASTWNPELARKTGQVLGSEARGRGKDVSLGPSVNIKRSPLCGRNFEYMSEDPCLTAGQAVPFVQGVQESDVAACVKHFAANSQETDRLQVNETISERAMREIYLPAFEACVKQGGALSLMGAYNLVNDERCCESKTLLNKILREEWGFQGVVISDWGGVFRTRQSAESGLDVEMSVTSDFDDYKFAKSLKQAVENGEISQTDVDEKVFHVLCLMDALHMLNDQAHDDAVRQSTGSTASPSRKSGSYATAEHRASTLEVAREAVVLLKNDDDLLPLAPKTMQRLLVVGANADRVHSNGGGSAEIKTLYEVTPLLGLCGQLGGNVEVRYVPGYQAAKPSEQRATWQKDSLTDGTRADDAADGASGATELERRAALRDEAVRLAGEYDHVLFVGGLDHDYDLEGLDRDDMRLPYGQDELIEGLLEANANTVIALVGGSPVEMPWADKAKAIVWSWYNGTEAGTALAEVLLGSVNPSGHLPESFPIHLQDSPAHKLGTYGLAGHVDYGEDIYVGYRYFESRDVPVLFPFGHGLSYTTFAYSDPDVRVVDDEIHVHCMATNTGERAGKTVVQVYFGLTGTGEDRPVKELKGYSKISLQPGETKPVDISLPEARALSYWSNQVQAYAQASGAEVFIGQNAHDATLRLNLQL
ncbi:beta-glucosidase [Bifidobacterium bohemicum]|uniref:Beta-glucosidase n=1 Tax=Bifidobacterium bohemicum DSM 22767 TaxID=1437606 RepID=A0A086ZEL7_9BIFI|nr:glycoside hydrolase family 3 C-terminal domain-containing protein [Bifidobacterium bohemicum]KFI44967.1 beta-glucosidase [Bifidobacterium bohemicum DSM 22767]SCC12296.1 beta-glucosidase [Bifidobacterium bohemicum]